MKRCLFFLFVFALLAAACEQNPCKNVTCNHDGLCIDGTCSCVLGYEGSTCDEETRAKYAGNYKGVYTEDGIDYPESVIAINPESVLIVRMKVGNITVDLIDPTHFEAFPQQFSASGNTINITTATGSCDGVYLDYQIAFTVQGQQHTASFLGVRTL